MQGMLSRDAVALGLTYIATSLSRKIDQARIDIYHRELSRTLDDDQFRAAVAAVLDEDEKFPSIARLKGAGKGHRRQERVTPYIRDCGPLSECLSDTDSGRAYGGADQYRGRKHTKPEIERLVYEDAAVMAEAIPGEGLSARLRRIARKAEDALERMEALAEPAPEPIQGEL